MAAVVVDLGGPTRAMTVAVPESARDRFLEELRKFAESKKFEITISLPGQMEGIFLSR
jgi:hypothetical protein